VPDVWQAMSDLGLSVLKTIGYAIFVAPIKAIFVEPFRKPKPPQRPEKRTSQR